MGSRARVTVIGSYNVGLVVNAERLPAWGETLFGNGFCESPGGKGSNQAVAASRLGGEVRFIGSVGTDRYGDDAISMLKKEQIDLTYLKRTGASMTGVGFVFLNKEGDNCIVVDPGANLELMPEDIDNAAEAIEQSDVILFQLESSLDTVRYGLKTAREKGKVTILNPAPAQKRLDDLLPYATYVTPNETELKIMSGLPPEQRLTDDDCIQLGRSIISKGPEAVIVTMGERGALVILEETSYLLPSVPVAAVDTTGAGDSFNAALAVSLAEGKPLQEAAAYACAVGAYTVTGKEVIPALPTREQVELFLAERKEMSHERS
ncbi:ribokinase [Xylanibacillus composti]|uniref:Ribokinase n=1 Tax=Xylanibacillus composti TaxID=1572762 RepID=A0A8J4H4W7_9BACL|nr:ribokinase [Xylanibacillus composti]MDT9726530.1 ribokinase [Xylanibacillus composti]GIQ68949.1 ribokinase [Xylanibacillus composti]